MKISHLESHISYLKMQCRSGGKKEVIMELEKIRTLSDEELKAEEAKAAEQLFRVRFAKSLGKQEGLKNLRSLKLDIARIKTIARERQLAATAEGKK